MKVVVANARLGEQLEFDVAGADVLAAFYHLFAYVGRGLGSRQCDASPMVAERRAGRRT